MHKTAETLYINRLATYTSCSYQLASNNNSKTVKANREYLAFIIDSISLLCKQGIPLHGHDESEDTVNRGNLLELLSLRNQDNDHLKDVSLNTRSYLSPQVQYEIVDIIANEVIKSILPDSDTYFAIIVNQTIDIAWQEQSAFFLRYLDSKMQINE